MGGQYLPGTLPQGLAVLAAFISSINIAGTKQFLAFLLPIFRKPVFSEVVLSRITQKVQFSWVLGELERVQQTK